MKRLKYLICFMVCVFACPLISNAECSYERQAELSRIASNVQFSYTYEMTENYPRFTVSVTNITNDIYVIDDYGVIISGATEGNRTYQGSNNIEFVIYSNDSSCRGEKLLTQYVSFPTYNKFYNTNKIRN